MFIALFWIYLADATLLIVHEIDSAYQKEWELFKLPGGPTGFMALHIPLVLAIILGLYLAAEESLAGLILSLLLSAGGIFAFTIHNIFLKKGDKRFSSGFSIALLWAMLPVSLAQMAITIYLLAV
ncbi:MAG: hypothetical protein PHG51_07740 [Candidatus Omnitrophica bacterium]|nr:hypothetical protein [Candidatus Omnitrophota bacterium]